MSDKKQEFMTRPLVVWVGALISCLLWGSAFPCIKLGYQWFAISGQDTSSQIVFAGCRFFLAGVLAVIIGSIIYRKPLLPQKESAGKILHLSLLQTVGQYFFFYVGLAHTTGVKASIVEALNVFVAILVAACIYHQEKLDRSKVIGCIIGFMGVVLVNLQGMGLEIHISFLGEGCIFISTVMYAFSSVYLKRYSSQEEPFVLSGYQFILGGILLAAMGLIMGGFRIVPLEQVPVKGWLMLCYLGLVSAVAYSLWGELLKYNSVSRVAVFGFMTPVFGVILSALLLGEADSLNLMMVIISLVLVSIGTLLAQRRQGATA